MTLTAQIRRLTGVTMSEVDDVDVQAALDEHRAWQDQIPVILQPTITNVWKRGYVDAWGSLEPATDAAHVGTTLVTSLGADVTGTWTLGADGHMTFGTDQGLAGMLYLSAYSFDVKAAAVDVIDQLLGVLARDYDVKLSGDQELKRSQAVAQLEARRDKLAAGRLVQSVQRGVVDDSQPASRAAWRLERRAMRE